MGEWLTFSGKIEVEPPLNEAERFYLEEFSLSRRMRRPEGAYSTAGPNVRWFSDGGHNEPPEGQPSLWCHWQPSGGGQYLFHPDGEASEGSGQWVEYLIDHFLSVGGKAEGHLGFEEFTFDHTLNGTVHITTGRGGRYMISVVDNQVEILAC